MNPYDLQHLESFCDNEWVLFRSQKMKSFKIVAVIIGLSLSALVIYQNTVMENREVMIEDTVGTGAAAPVRAEIPL
jgi:hypothetical protein